jgi:hypothetical protein
MFHWVVVIIKWLHIFIKYNDYNKCKEMVMDKIKELSDKVRNRKLDIIQALAEDRRIFEPNTLLNLIWELRGLVDMERWIDEPQGNS